MGKRRVAMGVSDDDQDLPSPNRKLNLSYYQDDEETNTNNNSDDDNSNNNDDDNNNNSDEMEEEEAIEIGEVIRVSGKGGNKKEHYESFQYDDLTYDLEDPVLLSPEGDQKPYVAIIKDVYRKNGDDSLMVTGQWFYRPEEADKKGGGNWQSSDTRELYYSFHRDDIPAESVMHKCVVHFIPLNKQIPLRKEHPGFIVQKVYDTEQKRLFKLTDKDYEDNKQEELDVLVNKTIARIGVLLDIETVDAEQEDVLKSKRLLKRKNMLNVDVSRDEDVTTRSGQSLKPETPVSVSNNASEHHAILSEFKALTGEDLRDKWLERLLRGIQFICTPTDGQNEDKGKGGSPEQDSAANCANESQEKSASDKTNFIWPDAVVPGVIALEKAAHEEFSSDFTKYNQKLRQLLFNLTNNSVLATRLIKGELDASKLLSMTPTELKEGLTAEELASKQPEESAPMQMTDTRCKRCSKKAVVLLKIIQTGHGARYQMECKECGNVWYASRDEVSTLTIDGPNAAKNVGTPPLATSKFENVEKTLVSPRESNKSTEEIIKKTTEAYMPLLEIQRSFKK